MEEENSNTENTGAESTIAEKGEVQPQKTSTSFIQQNVSEQMVGKTIEVLMPSGFKVTIREQNGEDDDTVSKVSNNADSSAINKFLSNIILKNNQLNEGTYTSENDVKKWKLKDKYYLLLKSRLFSLGDELTFQYQCIGDGCKKIVKLEELLSKYDWPLDKVVPKKGEEGYEELVNNFYPGYIITRYPNGKDTHRELQLSSGMYIKYKYLDGIGEKKILDIGRGDISKNAELISRDFSIKKGKDWQKIVNFKMFTASLMREIRADIKINDYQFEISSDITCPHCGDINTISLIAMPNFFFPDEIS